MNNLRLSDSGFGDSFESALRRFFSPTVFEAEARAPQMRIDVSEKDDTYLVKADIPGVKKEDISVRIDGNVVRIDAEVKQETDSRDKAGKVLRSERYYGSVTRSFSLAQDVDDARAKASYADGVLHLELPRKTGTASRKLAIQ
jgi:HSP20 family protein